MNLSQEELYLYQVKTWLSILSYFTHHPYSKYLYFDNTWKPNGSFCCSVAKSCLTLRSHELQHARLPCSSLPPRICSESCPLSGWCYLSNHLILCHSLLLLPSVFTSTRHFSKESALHIKWSRYWRLNGSFKDLYQYKQYRKLSISKQPSK